MEGEIVDIVKRLDKAVDLVISGHTHQAYLCRVDGRPVTSAGSYGRFLTEIDLDLDRDNHDVVHAQTNNIRIDPQIFPADPKVAAIVNQYARLAAPRAGRVVAKLSSALSEQANSTGESELGDVIADAQLAATRAAGAQIAFMNQGGIRAPLIPAHGDNSISYGNIFATQPFGNSLVTMTLTGEQIRRLLEQQFTKGVNSADQHPRLIQVSNGFAYAWDATRPTGQRILVDSIRLNGRALASDATFRVTVNSFMADGGDSFSVLTEGLEREVGMPDIDALEAYLSANSPLAAIPYRRIVRAK
jgi:5'-nucleotidase